ncbi:hypothetical protein YC2023_074798 [Brassica napus]
MSSSKPSSSCFLEFFFSICASMILSMNPSSDFLAFSNRSLKSRLLNHFIHGKNSVISNAPKSFENSCSILTNSS